MSLFNKKETIIMKTEQQRDAFIEKLQKAHVPYEVSEDTDNCYNRDTGFLFHINASDMKKVG